MRHNRTINHLGRKADHRKAMLANMASSLILHKKISTTLAKAKALRVYIEPLITKSKVDSTHSRRTVFSYLSNKVAVTELFREVSKKIADRPGGYTRILKTGTRLGDNAEMCIIELVDYNELMLAQKETKTPAKTTRRGRSSGAKKTTDKAVEPTEEKTAPKTRAKKAAPAAEEAEPEIVGEVEVVEDAQVIEEADVVEEVTDQVEIADEAKTEEPEITEEPKTDETTEEPKKEE
jgi:large subunit ribosomal protein L17